MSYWGGKRSATAYDLAVEDNERLYRENAELGRVVAAVRRFALYMPKDDPNRGILLDIIEEADA